LYFPAFSRNRVLLVRRERRPDRDARGPVKRTKPWLVFVNSFDMTVDRLIGEVAEYDVLCVERRWPKIWASLSRRTKTKQKGRLATNFSEARNLFLRVSRDRRRNVDLRGHVVSRQSVKSSRNSLNDQESTWRQTNAKMAFLSFRGIVHVARLPYKYRSHFSSVENVRPHTRTRRPSAASVTDVTPRRRRDWQCSSEVTLSNDVVGVPSTRKLLTVPFPITSRVHGQRNVSAGLTASYANRIKRRTPERLSPFVRSVGRFPSSRSPDRNRVMNFEIT